MSLKKVFHTAIRVSSWSHAVAIGSIALILSACTDYVDKYEGDYKDDYGDRETFIQNLNSANLDLASVCSSGDWFWCASQGGAYTTSNDGKIETYSSGDVKFTFTGTDDNAYKFSTNELGNDLLPYLRRNGGISVSVEGSGEWDAGLRINTGNYFDLLHEKNVVVAYENSCPGVKINLDVVTAKDYMERGSLVKEGTVLYRYSGELPAGGFQVLTVDPDQLTNEIGDSKWRTAEFSISATENRDRYTSEITIEFTESCPEFKDGKGLNLVGIGLQSTTRSNSGTVKSSSSSGEGGPGNNGGSTVKSSSSLAKSSSSSVKSSSSSVKSSSSSANTFWTVTCKGTPNAGTITWEPQFYYVSALEQATAKYSWTLNGALDSETNTAIKPTVTYLADGEYFAQLSVTVNGQTKTTKCSALIESGASGFLWKGSDKLDLVQTDFGSGSKWYFGTDQEGGGSTTIQFPEINPYDECEGKCGMVWFGNTEYPYATVGFNLDENGTTYDVSAWKGLCIAYYSPEKMYLKLDLQNISDYGSDLPAAELPSLSSMDEYRVENIEWASFKQGGWGNASTISGEEAARILKGVVVTFAGSTGGSQFFNIYQIGSYGRCSNVQATSVDLTQFHSPESSSSAESSSSGENPQVTCANDDLWCGPQGIYKVLTGLDAGDETSGYWFSYADDADGGNSRIDWPVERGNEYSPDAFDPVVDYCGGICGTYTLDKGTLDYDPDVGVGFSIAGTKDGSSKPVAADASGWGGVCITYTADNAAKLILDLGDAKNAELASDKPFVTLGKTTVPQEKCFAWSDFEQDGWGVGSGGTTISGYEASKILVYLNFEIQAKTGTTGGFNVIRIRKYPEGLASSSSSSSASNPAWEYLNPAIEYGEFTDERDGQVYKTIDVGNYTWFAQNLNLEYNDGEGNSCPGSDPDSCAKYGRMYTWAAAMDTAGVYSTQALECGAGKVCGPIDPVQGVCPEGWHLPSNAEWRLLVEAAGGESTAAVALKSTKGWVWNSSNTSGTDDLGFSAIPNGPGEYGYFWSGTENSNISGYRLRLMGDATPSTHLGDGTKSTAMYAVRCVKEKNPKPRSGSFTYQGQTYNYVRIGTQTWMAENLNYDIGNNMCYKNDPANCTAYGRMYKWATVVGKTEAECGYGNSCDLPSTGHVQGICPEGWHVPRRAEVETLVEAAGGDDFAGKALKATSTWSDYENNGKVYGNGTDATGFTGYSTGTCSGSSSEPYCNYDGMYTHMWTITENYSGEQAYYFGLLWMGNGVTLLNGDKRDYKNLRCVQDED
ncbi:MAG: hypothetical protein J6P30_01050 [Fibrobacter sp.]|nr:hypothetical protein [Fibrobacter sp.]